MSEEEKAFYAEERERAMRLLDTIPDNKLEYVIGFLEGALIPVASDPFYSPENIARLEKSAARVASWKEKDKAKAHG